MRACPRRSGTCGGGGPRRRSMTTIAAACFLLPVLALLPARVQSGLRKELAAHPALVFSAPAYKIRAVPPPSAADFALVLWFWLPLEFSVGAAWIPRSEQALLHVAAYGAALTLALVIFLLFRGLEGMKYNLPRSARDGVNLMAGFAIAAPVLIAAGRAVGFLGPAHRAADPRPGRLAVEFAVILLATALPEELLFRSLIQNSLMQRMGPGWGALLLAGWIFGCAHLDNGPGPLPNWRYMIVAAIAGVIYGRVFQKSSSVFASAGLHALVNTIKHNFF